MITEKVREWKERQEAIARGEIPKDTEEAEEEEVYKPEVIGEKIRRNEPPLGKTNNLHRRKQSRRSASQ